MIHISPCLRPLVHKAGHSPEDSEELALTLNGKWRKLKKPDFDKLLKSMKMEERVISTILYHTPKLLAGQLYKDRKFTSGMTGKEHVEHARERLERWMDFRFRFGFSEWLSMYYPYRKVFTFLFIFADGANNSACHKFIKIN